MGFRCYTEIGNYPQLGKGESPPSTEQATTNMVNAAASDPTQTVIHDGKIKARTSVNKKTVKKKCNSLKARSSAKMSQPTLKDLWNRGSLEAICNGQNIKVHLNLQLCPPIDVPQWWDEKPVQ